MMKIQRSEVPGGDPTAIADAAARAVSALAATPSLDRALAVAARRLTATRQAEARERARAAARESLLEQLAHIERAA